MEFSEIIVGVTLFFTLFVLPAVLIAWTILRPMGKAAKDRAHPTQFTIPDILCLFLIMLMTSSVIYWSWRFFGHQSRDLGAMSSGYLIVTACCLFLWFRSVQIMSQAGVRRPLHRCLFLVVVIPTTIYSAMAAPLIPFAILYQIKSHPSIPICYVATALPAMFIAYKLTRHIVLSASPITEETQIEPVVT